MKLNKQLLTIIYLTVLLISCSQNEKNKVNSNTVSQMSDADRLFPLPNFKAGVWHENKDLSLKDFYLKYQDQFQKEKIEISFGENGHPMLDGKEILPRHWENWFEKNIYFETHNPERAKIIYDIYKEEMTPLLPNENEKLIDKLHWLITSNAYLIGSPYFDLSKVAKRFQECAPLFENRELKRAFERFNQRLIDALYKPLDKNSDDTEKVVILTGPYGGGHLSTAKVLKQSLDEAKRLFPNSKKFEAVIIDECQDFPETLHKITKYHTCRVYNDVYLTKDDNNLAQLIYILDYKIKDYIIPDRFQGVSKKIEEINPSLIISALHHIDQHAQHAFQFNRPFKVMITDYSFPDKQWRPLNYMPRELTQYMITRSDKIFFREMISRYYDQDWFAREEGSHMHAIKERIFVNNEDFAKVVKDLGIFDLTGYPVSPKIKPAKNKGDIRRSRQALGMDPSLKRKVITFTRGGSSNDALTINKLNEFLKAYNAIGATKKLELVVLTVGNQSLTKKLMDFFSKKEIPYSLHQGKPSEGAIDFNANSSKPIIARILGRLSYPDEISKLYQATDLILSKAGGATSAEIFKAKVPYLRTFSLNSWEIENAIFLEHIGLGLHFHSQNNLEIENVDYSPYKRQVYFGEKEMETLLDFIDNEDKIDEEKYSKVPLYGSGENFVRNINRTIDNFNY